MPNKIDDKKVRKHLLSDLKFKNRVLEKIKSNNQSSNLFNLSIFYGIVFGILGNFIVSLSFSLWFENTIINRGIKETALLISLFLLSVVTLIIIKENKRFKENDKLLQEELDRLITDIEIIEKGEGIIIPESF